MISTQEGKRRKRNASQDEASQQLKLIQQVNQEEKQNTNAPVEK